MKTITRTLYCCLLFAAVASADTVTTFLPPSPIHVGDTFDVGIQFTSDGMYAYQFDVLFPAFLQANSVSGAGFFDVNGLTFALTIDNISDEIFGVVGSLIGSDPDGNVSCGGGTLFCSTDTLATINFTALAAGTGTLNFDLSVDALDPAEIVTDPNAMTLDPNATFNGADISVENSSVAAPEPGTLVLIALPLMALGIRRRRSTRKAR